MLSITYYDGTSNVPITVYTYSPVSFEKYGIEFYKDSHLHFIEYSKMIFIDQIDEGGFNCDSCSTERR